jgi:exodeoxyribonuclease V gamma subunit
MAINTYFGIDLPHLAHQLANDLRGQNQIFAKNFLVTGHQSTNDFLVESIAQTNGIAANLAFVRPMELVEIIFKVLELTSSQNLLKPHQLVWVLEREIALACDANFKPFETIKKYIDDDAHKRFTLAEQIIALFQSYQEDSPEIITTWNNNNIFERADIQTEDEAWQRYLWTKLKSATTHDFTDLTTVYEGIKIALDQPEKRDLLKEKIPFIALFGYLPYTPELVDLLSILGEHISVSIYYQHFETGTKSRFLENFGSLAKRHVELLQRFTPRRIDVQQDTENPSVLAVFQEHVKNPDSVNTKLNPDDSITISSSYTISREVEALYHYLIQQFEKDPSLMKRDVCVITPNVEAYAPAIEAFFSKSALPLDYTLYDTSHKIQTSPYAAIEALFKLEKDSFTSKKVLSLLEFQYIRESFGFDEDLNDLMKAVALANIHLGYAGDVENDTEFMSWRHGLKRLIFGACLPPFLDKMEMNGSSFVPIDEFEERSVFQLVQLHSFVEKLNYWIIEREKPRKIIEWVQFIENETIDVFIDFKTFEYNRLQRILGDLAKVGKLHTEPVSFYTFRYYILQHLAGLDGGERKGYGGIKFIAPSAYLSSPVKLFVFLGMNGKDFPRLVNHLSFDLSLPNRITKTDMDKNLFLNILLSAKSKVYFSYIGRDVKDNSIIPSSTVIDDLISELNLVVNDFDAKKFIVIHPLHAFNSKYNQIDFPHLIQFQSKDKKASLLPKLYLTNESNPFVWEEKDGKKVIELYTLKRFLEDPAQHYFNKVLGIYNNDDDVDVSEEELFTLDKLQSWKVKNVLLSAHFQGVEQYKVYEKLRINGQIPLANVGVETFNENSNELADMFGNETFQELLNQEKKEAKTVEIAVGDFIIRGKTEEIYANRYTFISASNNKTKYQTKAILQFYFTCLADYTINEMFYLTPDLPLGKMVSRPENKEMQNLLKLCCNLLVNGTTNPMNFLISYYTEKASPDNLEQFKNQLLSDLNNPYKNFYPSIYFLKMNELHSLSEKDNLKLFLEIYKVILQIISPFKN